MTVTVEVVKGERSVPWYCHPIIIIYFVYECKLNGINAAVHLETLRGGSTLKVSHSFLLALAIASHFSSDECV